jgi:hypothetical protein
MPNRRALWPVVTAVLIGLPLLYVASFGPACWLSFKEKVPSSVVAVIYRPLLLTTRGEGWGYVALDKYAGLCGCPSGGFGYVSLLYWRANGW